MSTSLTVKFLLVQQIHLDERKQDGSLIRVQLKEEHINIKYISCHFKLTTKFDQLYLETFCGKGAAILGKDIDRAVVGAVHESYALLF